MKDITNFEQKVLRIFFKNGGEGERIKVFNHLSVPEQRDIIENLDLQVEEYPIIGGKDQDERILALTSQRLIQKDGASVKSAKLRDMRGVRGNLEDAKFKTAAHQRIEIDLAQKGTIFFDIESGDPFFGIWNVLLFLATRNSQKGKRPE
jgi:hypothetical protein